MSAPTTVVTTDDAMPPRTYLVTVEHAETGALTAVFRPELGADERAAAVRALTDTTVRGRLLAALVAEREGTVTAEVTTPGGDTE